jgi:hypothetical protein
LTPSAEGSVSVISLGLQASNRSAWRDVFEGAPCPQGLPETEVGAQRLSLRGVTEDVTRRTFGILWAETWPSQRTRKSVPRRAHRPLPFSTIENQTQRLVLLTRQLGVIRARTGRRSVIRPRRARSQVPRWASRRPRPGRPRASGIWTSRKIRPTKQSLAGWHSLRRLRLDSANTLNMRNSFARSSIYFARRRPDGNPHRSPRPQHRLASGHRSGRKARGTSLNATERPIDTNTAASKWFLP